MSKMTKWLLLGALVFNLFSLPTFASYRALELNGSGYASIADGSQSGLDMGLSDFMVGARVKTSYSAGHQIVVSKWTSTPGGYLIYVLSSGKPNIYLKDANGVTCDILATSTVNDDRWHYLVFVFDRSSATGGKIFIDGSETAYDTQEDLSALATIGNAAVFRVGATPVPSSFLYGLIDEVRVWNFGKDGLPADYAAYIAWRSQGRNVFLDISEYNSGSWNGYADAVRTNLLTNGDMEADTTWALRGSPTTEEQSTDQKNGGSYSWKIISDAAGEGAYQDVTTVVGEYYEVRGYIYVTAGDAKLGKEDTDGSDQVLAGQATAAAWTEFNVVFLATETTSRIFFQSDATAASTFYVDDVSVKRTGIVAHYKFTGDYTDETTNSNDLTAGGTGNTFPGYSLKKQKIVGGGVIK